MGKEIDQRTLNEQKLILVLTALTVSGNLEQTRNIEPQIGKTFRDEDLGNRFHDIRPIHTIGNKTPGDGKKRK